MFCFACIKRMNAGVHDFIGRTEHVFRWGKKWNGDGVEEGEEKQGDRQADRQAHRQTSRQTDSLLCSMDTCACYGETGEGERGEERESTGRERDRMRVGDY